MVPSKIKIESFAIVYDSNMHFVQFRFLSYDAVRNNIFHNKKNCVQI